MVEQPLNRGRVLVRLQSMCTDNHLKNRKNSWEFSSVVEQQCIEIAFHISHADIGSIPIISTNNLMWG